MHVSRCLASLLASAGLQSLATALNLNITAVGAQNGASTLECWTMDTPFSIASTPGIAGSASIVLGDVTNFTYVVIPSGLDGGLHHAPSNQWVWFVSGLAYITLPTDETTAAFVSGEFGLIFAADTADVSRLGHRTQYSGITETVSIAMPTTDGMIPSHSRLHYGPCSTEEIAGYAFLASGLS
ncbi:hypothetical protein M406DRAFT_261022 [Cryphonectria parasitica EP155]|uniref:Small secreted protein n=1 Tax=Cryphonectria parasitica (strain ATCC 38755 / EP155) TaxID=660469 RepID=A0A9P4XYR2_CRYP1|nr:uncharacterized protein M406DRAFT_261022 [Cryphonectria parasitica EP155]KAF3763240.1 hypothetical protein M406DRAFT_261022 [Cryphonectria parasitica EP155]